MKPFGSEHRIEPLHIVGSYYIVPKPFWPEKQKPVLLMEIGRTDTGMLKHYLAFKEIFIFLTKNTSWRIHETFMKINQTEQIQCVFIDEKAIISLFIHSIYWLWLYILITYLIIHFIIGKYCERKRQQFNQNFNFIILLKTFCI